MDLYAILLENFPDIVREEATAKRLLKDPENHIITKYAKDVMVGISVIHKNAIYMLCVFEQYRGCGYGASLLEASEAYIKAQGYDKVIVGCGDDYLMPGVPMKYNAHQFFEKYGYIHSWGDCGCFDMNMDLQDFNKTEHQVGDTVNGVLYRWGTKEDIPRIAECVRDAEEDFVQYYVDAKKYEEGNDQRILIAELGDVVCGALIVSVETEGKGLGSVGCTATATAYQGRGIASTMVMLGTHYLKQCGMERAFLGYTYTDILRMYGRSGYEVCMEYMMAEKEL